MRKNNLYLLALATFVSLTGGISASAQACDLLSEADIRAILPDNQQVLAQLQQRSEVADRCQFSWQKANIEALQQQNDEALKNQYRRNQPTYEPKPVYNRLEAERYFKGKDLAAAKTKFLEYTLQDLPKTYGSPDPLAGSTWELLSLGSAQAAWSKVGQRLLVQHKENIYLISVLIQTEPEQNKELALKLAERLLATQS